MPTPALVRVTRKAGVAGQIALSVEQADGTLTFVGSTYGTPGPVVMVTPLGHQVFVTEPSRFGEVFNAAWVRRFLAD